jgi:PEGA domain
MRRGAVILLSFSFFGCAAAFRGTKDTVTIESTPPGAEATRGPRKLGLTPTQMDVERSGVTQVTLTKSGYEDHNGVVKKQINAGWVTLDILTCVIPVALCIPILVDALTGAWYDVEDKYIATMRPGTTGGTLAAAASTTPAIPVGTTSTAPAPAPSSPPVDMSESERKATARAAYLEGIKLQENGNCAEALPRLEAAQKLFSAPTHLLHIGQCQSATGKLVEAAETYESLVRTMLTKDSPDVFRQAQDEGRKELAQIKPRIPTLRVQLTPAPSSLSSLVVKVNGNAIPSELLGLARPVNPGKYKVTVWAAGYKEASETVDVPEASPKAVELKLSK